MEESFPRGGSSDAPLVTSKPRSSGKASNVKTNFLGEVLPPTSKRAIKKASKYQGPRWGDQKRTRRSLVHGDDPLESEDSDSDDEGSHGLKKPRHARILRTKHISPGLQILGSVKEINDFTVTISLLNHLVGYLSITEISDVLTEQLRARRQPSGDDMDVDSENENEEDEELAKECQPASLLAVGQWLPVSILAVGTETKPRIELSSRESIINKQLEPTNFASGALIYGSVKSVEDHGYVVSIGVGKYSGFLPKSAGDGTLLPGQPSFFAVTSLNKSSKVLTLSREPRELNSAQLKAKFITTFDGFYPGALVKTTVDSHFKNGLWLKFLDLFAGSVDVNHLDQLLDYSAISDTYKKGTHVKARIVAVDRDNRELYLSMLPECVEMKPIIFPINIGDIFPESSAIIRRVDPAYGVALELTVNDRTFWAYAHSSRAVDDPVDDLSSKFSVGTKLRARCVGFAPSERSILVTLRPSLIDQPLLTLLDLQPGMLVQGTVERLNEQGVVVRLADSITGYCPASQVSVCISQRDTWLTWQETQSTNAMKRFNLGQSIQCRVLTVNVKERRLILTYKRTMVKSDLAILSSYDQCKIGVLAHGTIVSVTEHGCVVTFYNQIKGFVPRSEMSRAPISDVASLYRLGQVVQCRVLSCVPDMEELKLSFVMPQSQDQIDAHEKNFERLLPFMPLGSIVKAKIVHISAIGLDAELILGKKKRDRFRGFIPANQLSDFVNHSADLLRAFKIGQIVSALVIKHRSDHTSVTLSLKPVLQWAAASSLVPSDHGEVAIGTPYIGTISKTTTFGAIVQFLGHLSGIAFRKDLADRFVENPHELFAVGQTVCAVALEKKDNPSQIILSMRPLYSEEPFPSLSPLYSVWLGSLFDQKQVLEPAKDNVEWSLFEPGNVVNAEVLQIESVGVVLSLGSEQVTGFCQTPHLPQNGRLKIGDSVKGIVLNVNRHQSVVDISLRQSLVSSTVKSDSLIAKSVGTVHSATLELVHANYLVLSFKSKSQRILAIAPSTHLNDSFYFHPFKTYSLLSEVQIEICPPIEGLQSSYVACRVVQATTRQSKPKFSQDSTQLNSTDEVHPGMVVKCEVRDIFKSHMNVSIGLHVKGRIHVTEVSDHVPTTEEERRKKPFDGFKSGDILPECRVLGISTVKSHNELAITRQTANVRKIVEVTLRPPESGSDLPPPRPTWTTIELGATYRGIVHKVSPDGLWVHLARTVRGRVFLLDASHDINVLNNIETSFFTGQVVVCKVLRFDAEKQSLDLSIKALEASKPSYPDVSELKIGSVIPGRLSRVVLGEGLYMQLFAHSFGKVHFTDISDEFQEEPLQSFIGKEGQIYNCCVIDITSDKNSPKIALSLRSSRINPDGPAPEYPEITRKLHLQVGIPLQGYVKNIDDRTCWVTLSRNQDARIFVSNLSTTYLKHPQKSFPAGTLVKGHLLKYKIDGDLMRIEMSLKPPRTRLTFDEIEIGAKYSGKIKAIQPFGVFVSIDGSLISGLCHISESHDKEVKDEAALRKLYTQGDRVRVLVIRKNDAKKQVSLSLKPSHFVNDQEEVSDSKDNEDGVDMDVSEESDNDSLSNDEMEIESEDGIQKQRLAALDSDESGVDNSESESEDSDDEESDEQSAPSLTSKQSLKRSRSSRRNSSSSSVSESDEESEKSKQDNSMAGDVERPTKRPRTDTSGVSAGPVDWSSGWNLKQFGFPATGTTAVTNSSDESSESSDSESHSVDSKKSKKSKSKETSTPTSGAPASAEEFEKILLSNPNASYAWIQFMAFWISRAQLDRARDTAESALKRINPAMESEKFNVWIALLNLENSYGTKESFQAVFKRSLQFNDTKKIYKNVINIFENSGNTSKVDELYKTLISKFHSHRSVWISRATSLFKQGNRLKEARDLLQRALKTLPKRKHTDVIVKFAQLEYRFGDSEIGRALFEDLVATYPKRVDIWNVYLDQETIKGNIDRIRSLHERVIALKLSSVKKMKTFFKRYLKFEVDHGDAARVAYVKRKAAEYVESRQ